MGRVWWPERPRLWRRRKKNADDSGMDWLDVGAGDLGEALLLIALGIVVVVTFFLLFTVVFPLVVLGLEILILLILAVAGLAGRLVAGRPWTVRARADDGRSLTWQVPGFAASARVRDAAAEALARGEQQPRPAEALDLA